MQGNHFFPLTRYKRKQVIQVRHSDVQHTDTRTLDFSSILCIFSVTVLSLNTLVMTTSSDHLNKVKALKKNKNKQF